MKSAEEVAEKFLFANLLCSEGSPLIGYLAQALTDFAEQIKEDRDRWADSACRLEKAQEKIREQARAEALEEAAKMADEGTRQDSGQDIAKRIRALKENAELKESIKLESDRHNMEQDSMCQQIYKLETENAELKKECETLLWNLAGCDTLAQGYGVDQPYARELARPALDSVWRLAHRCKKLEAVARAAEVFEKKLMQVENDPAYISVWSVSQNHVGQYRGPQWTDELKAFQEALAALKQTQ